MSATVEEERIVVESKQNHMNTTFSFLVSCKRSQQNYTLRTLNEAHRLCHQIEWELSEFIEGNPLQALHQLEPGESMTLPLYLRECLTQSLFLSQATQGSFNCQFRSHPKWSGPGYEVQGIQVTKIQAGVRLGFGAVGKGYAIDKVRSLLLEHDIWDFCLSAGHSSIALSGFENTSKVPWQVGWDFQAETEKEQGLIFEHPSGQMIALGISANHPLKPHIETRGHLGDAPLSTMVCHTSAAVADAYSTALYREGEHCFEGSFSLPQDLGAAVMQKNKQLLINSKFKSFLQPVLHVFFSLFSSRLLAQEEFDLSQMFGEVTNPYLIERSDYWIVLPLIVIVILIFHLMKNPLQSKNKGKHSK